MAVSAFTGRPPCGLLRRVPVSCSRPLPGRASPAIIARAYVSRCRRACSRPGFCRISAAVRALIGPADSLVTAAIDRHYGVLLARGTSLADCSPGTVRKSRGPGHAGRAWERAGEDGGACGELARFTGQHRWRRCGCRGAAPGRYGAGRPVVVREAPGWQQGPRSHSKMISMGARRRDGPVRDRRLAVRDRSQQEERQGLPEGARAVHRACP